MTDRDQAHRLAVEAHERALRFDTAMHATIRPLASVVAQLARSVVMLAEPRESGVRTDVERAPSAPRQPRVSIYTVRDPGPCSCSPGASPHDTALWLVWQVGQQRRTQATCERSLAAVVQRALGEQST